MFNGRNVFKVVLRKPKRKQPHCWSMREWEGTTEGKRELISCGSGNDRWCAVVNTVMNLRVL
jgi:hypothetical protein